MDSIASQSWLFVGAENLRERQKYLGWKRMQKRTWRGQLGVYWPVAEMQKWKFRLNAQSFAVNRVPVGPL